MKIQQLKLRELFNLRSLVLLGIFAAITFFVNAAFVNADAGHDHGDVIESGTSDFPVVTVAKVQSAEAAGQHIEASGEVLPRFEAGIFPNQEGIIDSLFVDIGSRVTEGQVIGYLRPNMEQVSLQAELLVKQAELDADKEKSELLRRFSAYDGSEIDEITSQEIQKIDVELANIQKNIVSANKVFAADIAQIDGRIVSLEKQERQLKIAIKSALVDVVDAIGSVIYDTADVRSSLEYSRGNYRLELYGKDSQGTRSVGEKLGLLYTKVHGAGEVVNDGLIADVIDLGNETRALVGRLSVSQELSQEAIEELRSRLNEEVDHLIEVVGSLPVVIADQLAAISEKEKLNASNLEKLTELEGGGSVLQKEKDQLISQAVFDQIETNYDVRINEASVRSLQQQLGAGREVYAPFSGTITRRHVNIGDSVSLDRPLFDMIDDTQKFIRFFITEDTLPFVQGGMVIEYASHSTPMNRGRAEVTRISRSLDKETKTILVEAEIIEDEISRFTLSHMNVRTYIPVRFEQHLLSLPLRAFDLAGDAGEVWVINEDIEAVKVGVEVVAVRDDVVYVAGGVDENAWVIVKSPVLLSENLAVDTKL